MPESQWNGEGGPEAGALGEGRSGWAGAHGCARRLQVCGPFPRLGFAARGRCGPSRETRQGSRVAPWDLRRGRVWTARRARRLQGTWLGGALGAGVTQAGGCALIVSSTRLRRARLHRGHSTRPWHVIDGLRVCSVGQRQCRPERGVVTTARPSAEHLQSIPARPAYAGGGHWATERAPTESAACACGVRSIGRVDTTGCASGAGPAAAGAGVRHAES